MTGLECYAAWAPEDAVWSPWAKPVLFVALDTLVVPPGGTTPPAPDTTRLPDARRDMAVIVELAGGESVRMGLELARRGFRPVPLYNATDGPSPAVDVRPIAEGLLTGAAVLRETRLEPEAPPAFLLDAGRRPTAVLSPGRYDNRWIVLPQDFPSATFLLGRGIRDVVLIQRGEGPPREDLAHVLRRWQDSGIRIASLDLEGSRTAERIEVRPPSRFRQVWYRVIALLGLRRSNVGGFGAVVPEETSGSGFRGGTFG
jgi:hypothetical protein